MQIKTDASMILIAVHNALEVDFNNQLDITDVKLEQFTKKVHETNMKVILI